MKDKTVYFLKPVGAEGPIKIGCSVQPAKRLRDLEIWSPVLLEIVATAPGGHGHEKALHYLFADQRRHGEWFEVSPALLDVIDHVRRLGSLPPLEIPRGVKEHVAASKARAGKLPRRNNAARLCKYRLTKRVNEAEKHAYGFRWLDACRPEPVARIMAEYLGFGSNVATAEQEAVLDHYIKGLLAMPKADRSMAAWRRWHGAAA